VPSPRTDTTVAEAATVTFICFGIFIVASLNVVASDFRTNSTTFTDSRLLGLIVTELVLAAAALTFLYARRYPIASLWPAPTLPGCAIGLGLFFAAWVAGNVTLTPFVAGQAEQPITQMVNEARLSLPVIFSMAVVNGTYEEVFLLGFLQRGLQNYGRSVALGVMVLVRLLYHMYQGPLGALWVVAFGLVLGLYYIRSGSLWPPVFAHILCDIVPFMTTQAHL
jgi:membrane protease YdiL (CAAX protease family)